MKENIRLILESEEIEKLKKEVLEETQYALFVLSYLLLGFHTGILLWVNIYRQELKAVTRQFEEKVKRHDFGISSVKMGPLQHIRGCFKKRGGGGFHHNFL